MRCLISRMKKFAFHIFVHLINLTALRPSLVPLPNIGQTLTEIQIFKCEAPIQMIEIQQQQTCSSGSPSGKSFVEKYKFWDRFERL